MARAKAPEQIAREIVEVPVDDEMRDSFMPYALSVTTSRAIPDVRDGLKPVQRRILYVMADLGLRPGSPFRKSAGVVGEVMGKYHPHGDGAIYEAMVRMGQPFSMSVPLVDPKGNFGSLDDPPAAYRYTEARLTPAAMAMVTGLDEETVDFSPNFDGERDEPTCLPAAIPNLLVNGASGIAVGMATNMPPHNLSEIASAIEHVLTKRRPKPTVDDLMRFVEGPDFPTGGIVVDDGSLREAYETGRGTIRVRARAEIENITARRQGIVITELPYAVGPERVQAKVRELITSGKLDGIAAVVDLSDRNHGLRLVIECKSGVGPHGLLEKLYRLTPLEESFGINNVALVDGVPTTLNLYELCGHYVEHRLEVIVRRTEFRLARAEEREHILQGLLLALDNIDHVISIIRGSDDATTARAELMNALKLSEIQATPILDMHLRRRTALDVETLREA
ncbi:MAG: DNA gyrase subunit A, partial [Actinomycetota bacterium]|nr:DNA gyrase subunit A [Actinomycetota bacterium]